MIQSPVKLQSIDFYPRQTVTGIDETMYPRVKTGTLIPKRHSYSWLPVAQSDPPPTRRQRA